MTEYYTNFFAIRNPDELECTARIFRVEGLPNVELEKNVNILRRKIRQESRCPAAILWSDGEPRIAVHADAEGIEGEYQIVPSVAQLVDLGEEITINLDNISPQTEPIASEFVDWYTRGHFWRNTWQDGKKHFPLRPENLGKVLRYRGFSLDTKYLPFYESLCLVLDITHRYCDAIDLGTRLSDGEENLLGMGKTYLYHFGRGRYLVHALDVSGYPASETNFVLENNRTENVYSYTVNVCKKDGTPINFSHDDPGIVYRSPGKTVTRMGISTLCHRTLKTDEPEVSVIHNQSILHPTYRFELIEEMLETYLSKMSFNGTPIELEHKPITVDAGHLRIPDHLFGNNAVLRVGGSEGVQLRNFPQKRLEYLLDTKAGILSSAPLENQFFAAPKNMDRLMRTHFRKELESGLKSLSGQNINLEPILFDSKENMNISDVVDSLFSSLDSAGVNRGFGLLVLPRKKELIHDYVKQKGWPELVFKCVSQRKVESYYTFFTESGRKKAKLIGNTIGKFKSYVMNTMLGFLIVNQKWPWALDTKLNYDVHIGLDVLNGMAGLSFIYQNARNCFFDAQPAGPREKLSRKQISRFIQKAMQKHLNQLDIQPNSILLHRDGLSYQSEIIGFHDAVDELIKTKLLPPSIFTGVVEVRKTFALSPRLFKPVGERTFDNPEVGAFFVLNSKEGVVCNTGWPFRMQGTAKPLHIVITSGNLQIEDVLQDIYSLSNLAWASPRSSMSVPVTIKICDEFLRPIAAETDD